MKVTAILVVLAALLMLAGTVLAAADLTLSRHWIGGGGGEGQSGSLALRGSAGQAVAGGVAQGAFGVVSGFWQEAKQVEHRIYLPTIVRNTS